MEYFRQRFVDELNSEGDIEIRGNTWPRQEVLATMDKVAHQNLFSEWVEDAKASARDRAGEFLQKNDCLARFHALNHRLRLGNVLPFVGAGLSVASGFLPWREFLLSLLSDAPQVANRVTELIAEGNFEQAAQVAHDALGASVLAEEISNHLGAHRCNARGPVRLLPSLFRGEVITTNFDYVLPRVFDEAGHQFDLEIGGAAIREAPARLGKTPHCLLRIHGEADVSAGRVLTADEYLRTYTEERSIQGALAELLGTRSLLFMGCSLNGDRFLDALRDLKQANSMGGSPHYAFLPFPGTAVRAARRQFLAGAGIHPTITRQKIMIRVLRISSLR